MTTETTTLADQIDDLRKTIHGSGLDDKVKAILTKQLMDAEWAFADANNEAKAAVAYMNRATENAANFVAAADDFDWAARAARKAADAMKAAEVLFRDASRMWNALTADDSTIAR